MESKTKRMIFSPTSPRRYAGKLHNDLAAMFEVLNNCPYDKVSFDWKAFGYYSPSACKASLSQYIRHKKPSWRMTSSGDKIYLDRIKEDEKCI